MKVALCLSGHIRNLEDNYPSIKKHILDKFNTDVFIHTWDTYGWRAEGNDYVLEQDGFKGFDYYSGIIDKEKIEKLFRPKKFVIEKYETLENLFFEKSEKYRDQLKYPDKDRPINFVSMWYKIFKCNELKKDFELENNFTYDIVIRSRPDLFYFETVLDENILKTYKKALFVPTIESHGGASDIFALGSSKVIDIASSVYNELDSIYDSGCLMNPHIIAENYYDNYFKNRWIKYDFRLYFNRCRKKCGTLVCNYCHPSKKVLSNITEGKIY